MLRIYRTKDDPNENEVMRIAKKSGYTAVAYGETKNCIVYDLIKNKVGGQSKKVPKEQIEEMKAKGLSMKQIASDLNISRASLYNYIKSYKEEDEQIKSSP